MRCDGFLRRRGESAEATSSCLHCNNALRAKISVRIRFNNRFRRQSTPSIHANRCATFVSQPCGVWCCVRIDGRSRAMHERIRRIYLDPKAGGCSTVGNGKLSVIVEADVVTDPASPDFRLPEISAVLKAAREEWEKSNPPATDYRLVETSEPRAVPVPAPPPIPPQAAAAERDSEEKRSPHDWRGMVFSR